MSTAPTIDRVPDGVVDPRLRRVIDQITRNVTTDRVCKVPTPDGCPSVPTLALICEALERVIDSLQLAGIFESDILVDEFGTTVTDTTDRVVG